MFFFNIMSMGCLSTCISFSILMEYYIFNNKCCDSLKGKCPQQAINFELGVGLGSL